MSGRSIHAVQLSRASGRWRVTGAASAPRPDASAPLGEPDAARLADMLERRGFRGRDVVVAVPGDRLLTGVVELPAGASGKPEPDAARSRLAAAHKCEPGSLEVASWTLPPPARAGGGARAIAVACRTEEANELIDVFEAAGMIVRALDVRAWAAVRACGPHLDRASRPAAVLDVGWTAAHLVVLYAGVVVHQRVLPELGLHPLHAQLAEVFDLKPEEVDWVVTRMGRHPGAADAEAPPESAEAIGEHIGVFLAGIESELSRSLAYAGQEYAADAVGGLVVHGEGAPIPGLAEHLASALDVDMKIVAPADVAECPPALAEACRSPALITALGLARHEGE